MHAWVVGSGGLLGSAIDAAVRARGETAFEGAPVPWGTAAARAVLASDAARFAAASGSEPWAIYWAAGAAVVATDEREAQVEADVFTAFLEAVRAHRPTGPGALFVASSAGALYAGSAEPPFGRHSAVTPISPYGRLKAEQEQRARDTLADDIPVIAGRIANLYGPRTDVEKSQGLVFHLCRAAALRRSLNLYVPMETMRDYVFADDAASVIVARVQQAVGSGRGFSIEVIASGTALSVASVVATVERVTHRRVPLALGTHSSASRQVIDLRLAPTLRADQTSFPSGVRQVFDSVVGRAAPAYAE